MVAQGSIGKAECRLGSVPATLAFQQRTIGGRRSGTIRT